MASKSKKRRRVLGASCILAALIIAGSSFAWFTSKDEVTNRLSASANYGVSIVEDFTPPENFLPGQKVNKDVAVVNTGNVDAFVRAWVDGEMSLVAKTDYQATAAVDAVSTSASKTDIKSTLTKTDDNQTKLTGINLNWYNGTTYYKELSQKKSPNPDNSSTNTTQAPAANNQDAMFSEVQSIQAGGVLVSHPAGADFYYVLEQATTVTGYKRTAGTTSGTLTTETYPAGTYVGTVGSKAESETDSVIIADTYYGNIDTSEFYPETEGLYLFRRNVKETGAANAVDDYEYTGYYFCKDETSLTPLTTTATGDDNDKSANDKRTGYTPIYLALCYDNTHTQRSDYVLPDGAVTTNTGEPAKDEVLPVTLVDVELFTAQEKVLKSYVASGAKTYTVNGTEVTVSNTATDVGGTSYPYSVVYGGKTYVSGTAATTEAGVYTKVNDAGNALTADTITVVETADDGFTWSYVPYTASSTAYTLTQGTTTVNLTGAPTASSAQAGYSYVVSDGTDSYYSATADGTYYKDNAGTVDTTTAYTYSATPVAAAGGVLTATYGTGDKQIKINVQLANLDNAPTASTAETWSVIQDVTGNDQKWTFYYNNDVEEGATTTKLIDSVELDKTVKDEAFLAFDFDLNVFMESAQVVLDEDGKESCDPIVAPWANPSATENNSNLNYNAATGAKGGTGTEIEYITWTNA